MLKLVSLIYLDLPDRNQGIIMECCQGLDTLNTKAEPGERGHLSLEQSQHLMHRWDLCEGALLDFYPSSGLEKALKEFRDFLFETVQNGFCMKEVDLKKDIVALINTCLTADSKNDAWKKLQKEVEDYQRFGTAEIFSTEQQNVIKAFGSAASLFYRYALHCDMTA